MNQYHYILTDCQFELHFENCILNPRFFNHEAHLRLAWIHIKKYGVEQAVENVCRQIKRYDKIFGGSKFNKTVTVAAVRATNHFMQKSRSDNFQDFLLEFPRLKNNFKELIEIHYSMDIFNHPRAGTVYLEPDLVMF